MLIDLYAALTRPPVTHRQRQRHQRGIRSHTHRRQCHHHIPARPELAHTDSVFPDLRKKLAIALLSSEQADGQHARPVRREKRADRVELGREDLEDNQREGKL